jgi:hypothetical protein
VVEKNGAKHKTCGSWLACDSGVSGNINVSHADVIAGKPAPTGLVVSNTSGSNHGSSRREHEAFVMKLSGLRPNAARFKGCRIFSDFAKVRYQTQSFT